MTPTRAVTALIAASLLLAAPAALAADPSPPAGSGAAAESEPKPDLAAFAKIKIRLADAIAAAEANGGGAIDATFFMDGDQALYGIAVYQNNSVREAQVDANTGKLVVDSKNSPEAQLDEDDKAELAALKNAKTTLGQAVAKAEQQSGGRAINAGLENRGGALSYDIEVVKDGAIQLVAVDPMTGQAAFPAGAAASPPQH